MSMEGIVQADIPFTSYIYWFINFIYLVWSVSFFRFLDSLFYFFNYFNFLKDEHMKLDKSLIRNLSISLNRV
jgi:hypothetical protein